MSILLSSKTHNSSKDRDVSRRSCLYVLLVYTMARVCYDNMTLKIVANSQLEVRKEWN